jgi:hypothetical protein
MQLLISTRRITRTTLLALGLLLTASVLFAQAQDDPDIVDDGPQANNVEIEANPGLNDATFDQWVFGNSMQMANASAARVQIEKSLDLQIASVNGVCPISEAQRKKLRLAGRGDVKRFFDKVEEKRTRFNLVKKDQNKIGEFYQEVIPLQAMLNAGLFREGSLFFKTLQSTLNDEQATKFAKLQEERRRFRWRAKVELVVDMWTNTLGLADDRRQRLVDAILDEIPAPKALGQMDYYFVMFKLSRMPEETLRPIFNDGQWKLFDRQLKQAGGFRMMLKQQGYASEDVDDPKPKAREVKK